MSPFLRSPFIFILVVPSVTDVFTTVFVSFIFSQVKVQFGITLVLGRCQGAQGGGRHGTQLSRMWTLTTIAIVCVQPEA